MLRAAVALVAIIAIWNIFLYFTTGTLQVITNEDSRVTIKNINTSKVDESTGKTKKRLKPGDYIVTAANKMGVVKQKVNIKARKGISIELYPVAPISVEPVMPSGAHSLSADSSHLYYVDYLSSQLYVIGDDGLPAVVANSPKFFGSIQWQDTTFGVGLSVDRSLYQIKDGVISTFDAPIKPGDDFRFNLAANGTLFITDGHDVYKKEKDKTFSKISLGDTGLESIGGISAGSKSVILFPKTKGGGEAEEHGGGATVVGYSGEILNKFSGSFGYESGWSPDGEHFIIVEDSSSKVYDSSLKGVVGQLPDANIISPVWLDSDTLVYAAGPDVFSYKLSNAKSEHLANVGVGLGVSGLFKDNGSKVLYIETEENTSSNTTRKIGRVNLDKTKAKDYLYGLDAFFPATYGDCDFNYFNFSQPVITFSANNPTVDCLRKAQVELKQNSLPEEAFKIVPAPVVVQEGE